MHELEDLDEVGYLLFQVALVGSHCGSICSTLMLVAGLQYVKEEEEEESVQPPSSKQAKTASLATAPAPTTSATTIGEVLSLRTHPHCSHSCVSFTITTCGIPNSFIPQCQNLPERKKIYLFTEKTVDMTAQTLMQPTHMRQEHLHLILHCASKYWHVKA